MNPPRPSDASRLFTDGPVTVEVAFFVSHDSSLASGTVWETVTVSTSQDASNWLPLACGTPVKRALSDSIVFLEEQWNELARSDPFLSNETLRQFHIIQDLNGSWKRPIAARSPPPTGNNIASEDHLISHWLRLQRANAPPFWQQCPEVIARRDEHPLVWVTDEELHETLFTVTLPGPGPKSGEYRLFFSTSDTVQDEDEDDASIEVTAVPDGSPDVPFETPSDYFDDAVEEGEMATSAFADDAGAVPVPVAPGGAGASGEAPASDDDDDSVASPPRAHATANRKGKRRAGDSGAPPKPRRAGGARQRGRNANAPIWAIFKPVEVDKDGSSKKAVQPLFEETEKALLDNPEFDRSWMTATPKSTRGKNGFHLPKTENGTEVAVYSRNQKVAYLLHNVMVADKTIRGAFDLRRFVAFAVDKPGNVTKWLNDASLDEDDLVDVGPLASYAALASKLPNVALDFIQYLLEAHGGVDAALDYWEANLDALGTIPVNEQEALLEDAGGAEALITSYELSRGTQSFEDWKQTVYKDRLSPISSVLRSGEGAEDSDVLADILNELHSE